MTLYEAQLNELSLWMILEQIKGIGPRNALKIIKNVSSLTHFFNHIDHYQPKLMLSDKVISELKKGILNEHLNYCDKAHNWLEKSNDHHIITYNSPHYPTLLKQIHNPPIVLYAKGSIDAINMPQIAIVGTRKASQYGLEHAFSFAKELTGYHYGITSGLALGIDTQAHLGALSCKGKTIAVLGTGLNEIYPAQNKSTVEKIYQNNGVILSEFPLNTKPNRHNFPRRNRIISGLSLGTIVIESSLKSGSLITANFALEQNREVFALPGNIIQSNSLGCHQLIRQGATLITSIHDVLEEIDPIYSLTSAKSQTNIKPAPSKPTSVLNSIEEKVLSHIDYQNTTIDIIIEKTGISLGEAYQSLLNLELVQKIEVIPGGYRKI